MENTFKWDKRIEKLQEVQEDLRNIRRELIDNLKKESPELINNLDEDKKMNDAINYLLLYLNNAQKASPDKAERIQHAIEQINEFSK